MTKARYFVAMTIDGLEVPSSAIRSNLTAVQANGLLASLRRREHHASVDWIVRPEIALDTQ